jgi:CHRD domain
LVHQCQDETVQAETVQTKSKAKMINSIFRIAFAALLTISVSGCVAPDGNIDASNNLEQKQPNPASCAAPNICLAVKLDGKNEYSPTGSAATGRAFVAIDVAMQKVTLSAMIDGIELPDLADSLVSSPIGPVHIHQYASDAVSALALTFPYGTQYQGRQGGFDLIAEGTDFAERRKLADPAMTFDAFVAAAKAGKLVLNVHTDKFGAGEISGVLLNQDFMD